MQIPAEIAFHNIQHSDWAEEAIREKIARLEKLFDRLVTCRVRVEKRANNANNSIPPVVRIEIGVPGHKDLVVSHEPEHLDTLFDNRVVGLRNLQEQAVFKVQAEIVEALRQYFRASRSHGNPP